MRETQEGIAIDTRNESKSFHGGKVTPFKGENITIWQRPPETFWQGFSLGKVPATNTLEGKHSTGGR